MKQAEAFTMVIIGNDVNQMSTKGIELNELSLFNNNINQFPNWNHKAASCYTI